MVEDSTVSAFGIPLGYMTGFTVKADTPTRVKLTIDLVGCEYSQLAALAKKLSDQADAVREEERQRLCQ